MAFTENDLLVVDQAMLKLGTGSRVVSFTVAGKHMEFGQADISELITLRNLIIQDVSATQTQPSYILTRTSKGL